MKLRDLLRHFAEEFHVEVITRRETVKNLMWIDNELEVRGFDAGTRNEFLYGEVANWWVIPNRGAGEDAVLVVELA